MGIDLFFWSTDDKLQLQATRNRIQSLLVVDDFGDMRGMLRSMLSSIGVAEIDTAINGREAIEALERKRYDVILCDYNLGPGKTGNMCWKRRAIDN